MYLTGFADEAAPDLATQIKATKEMGWNAISARTVNGKNIHELTDKEFDKVADTLDKEEIRIPEFGSLIGNWGKKIDSDFEITRGEITRTMSLPAAVNAENAMAQFTDGILTLTLPKAEKVQRHKVEIG